MGLNVSELIEALPADLEPTQSLASDASLQAMLQELAHRPVPVGRFPRLWALGTLQGKIAAAYLAWFLRSSYASAEKKEEALNEAHLKAALKLLGTMGYLRGAIMKLGQVLGAYPDVAPEQFMEVLGRLHFEAPAMHFSLLRENVRNELGDDPEALFADFETEAFAAASLGQVHRARLPESNRAVAVKIQYPNIARTIRQDLENFKTIMFPMRLSGDWDNLREQFTDMVTTLEMETDYEQEAENLRIARLAFAEADEIDVPRVYPERSTRRVLTMDLIEGLHLDDFLATNPSQEVRDRHGRQILLAAMKLSYGSHLLHADPHPGNYLFQRDGRLGYIDFGCCQRYTDQIVAYLEEVEEAMLRSPERLREALIRAGDLTPKQQQDAARLRLMEDWCDWVAEPLRYDGAFDFAADSYLQRGIELYGELVRRRYFRSQPINTWMTRQLLGVRLMLHRLGARVNMKEIHERVSG
ncbi:MAG: ABC1 kinase family protein [Phycisphaerales bacterium JB038]